MYCCCYARGVENVGDVIIAALKPCVEVADALVDGRSGEDFTRSRYDVTIRLDTI